MKYLFQWFTLSLCNSSVSVTIRNCPIYINGWYLEIMAHHLMSVFYNLILVFNNLILVFHHLISVFYNLISKVYHLDKLYQVLKNVCCGSYFFCSSLYIYYCCINSGCQYTLVWLYWLTKDCREVLETNLYIVYVSDLRMDSRKSSTSSSSGGCLTKYFTSDDLKSDPLSKLLYCLMYRGVRLEF